MRNIGFTEYEIEYWDRAKNPIYDTIPFQRMMASRARYLQDMYRRGYTYEEVIAEIENMLQWGVKPSRFLKAEGGSPPIELPGTAPLSESEYRQLVRARQAIKRSLPDYHFARPLTKFRMPPGEERVSYPPTGVQRGEFSRTKEWQERVERYLHVLYPHYKQGTRAEKSAALDTAQALTGYSRKTLIKKLKEVGKEFEEEKKEEPEEKKEGEGQ
jgi:hypothetical protein